LAGIYNKREKFGDAWRELELYVKEAKGLKDKSQLREMIARLKAKEKNSEPSWALVISSSAPMVQLPSAITIPFLATLHTHQLPIRHPKGPRLLSFDGDFNSCVRFKHKSSD